jgi:hypothetical protein
VRFAELYGSREEKYDWLTGHDVRSTAWTQVAVNRATCSFRPSASATPLDYDVAPTLPQAMPEHSLGVLTKRDRLVVGFTENEVLARVRRFADAGRSDKAVADEFRLKPADNDRWDLRKARRALESPDAALVRRVQYRCGDFRYYYDHEAVVARRNVRVLRHLGDLQHPALLVGRQGGAASSGTWDVIWATTVASDQNVFRRGGATVFPLRLREDGLLAGDETWNVSQAFADYVTRRIGEQPAGIGEQLSRREAGLRTSVHEAAPGYIYGLLHSAAFRAAFADQLRREFPRIPVVGGDSFFRLAEIGHRLLRVHLLDVEPAVTFPVTGNDLADAARFALSGVDDLGYGTVAVNGRGQHFAHVHAAAWERTCGGSPVLESYLDARRGRALVYEEIRGFQLLATALDAERALIADADGIVTGMLTPGRD